LVKVLSINIPYLIKCRSIRLNSFDSQVTMKMSLLLFTKNGIFGCGIYR
jgi:hypothetical protein